MSDTCPECGSQRIAVEEITADQSMFGRDADMSSFPLEPWDEPVIRRSCLDCWHHWDEWTWDDRPLFFVAKEPVQ